MVVSEVCIILKVEIFARTNFRAAETRENKLIFARINFHATLRKFIFAHTYFNANSFKLF